MPRATSPSPDSYAMLSRTVMNHAGKWWLRSEWHVEGSLYHRSVALF